MESLFQPQKQLKTYGNPRKTAAKSLLKRSNVKNNVVLVKRIPLTTKKAIELLISSKLKSNVCRYCLHMTYPLSELDQIMQIAGNGALYKVTIRDIMASFHPFKVINNPNFPNKICERCLNRAIHSYLFAQQCEQSERALRNCFDDVYEKFEKLDPLEKSKKRGRQKQRQNHNVIRVQHHQVIDYAEPIRNLINISSVSLTNEPQIGPLECKKCWQVLPNVESLANHENIHPKSMWYHCRLCGKSYSKKYQMNRHIKLHAKGKAPNLLGNIRYDKETGFVCKQCGQANENYDVHLQHIEKHKFKMVLEHLVDRKMDKLCSVCFDKEREGKLIEMDKIISLHGGYPELTGDRTLYNILGSTVPEPNYKYQELQISQKAKILMITRKVKKNVSSTKKTAFNLSLPVIISAENNNYVESYLFLFSVPTFLQQNETNAIELDHSIDQNENDTEPTKIDIPIRDFVKSDVDMISIPAEKQIKNIQDTVSQHKNPTEHLTFSKPDYNINIEEFAKSKQEQIESKHNLCNICWIFNKPTCKKCIEDNIEKSSKDSEIIVQKDDNKTDVKAKPCQFCWVFKYVGKCEYCRNIIAPGTVDAAKNTDNVFDVKSKPAKRKINSSNAAPKKSKWQCNICLVTNDFDRETCICCESKKEYNTTLNVDFGANKNKFLDFDKNVPTFEKISECTTGDIDIQTNEQHNINRIEMTSTPTTINSIEHPTTEMMELSNAQGNNTMPELSEPMDVASEEESSIKIIMDTLQDTPYEAPMFQIQENMPLARPEVVPNPFSFGIPPLTSLLLQQMHSPTFPNIQFNIGSPGPRKFKKPLRRIATTLHK